MYNCLAFYRQSGSILDANGGVIKVGYDQWGYNYQAHMFNGLYENYSRPATVVTEGTENLVMNPKTGVSTGTSMGWVTNHFEGDYTGSDGEQHHYTYFAKIAYVGPAQSPDPFTGLEFLWIPSLFFMVDPVYQPRCLCF